MINNAKDIFDLKFSEFENKIDNFLDSMTEEQLLNELIENGLELN